MPRYQKKIYAGDVYECEEYFAPRAIGKSYTRGERENLTCEEQKEVNARQARKKLARLINANFKEGDLFVTLTHRERQNYDDAKKELAKFLRRVRRWRAARGLSDLKYIAVTESKRTREHHHLILSGMNITATELSNMWGQGRVMVSNIEIGGDYTGLAKYVTKETPEEGKKRWSQSKNLKQPRIVIVRMGNIRPKKKLTVPKGYREVEQYAYYSEMTGDIRYLKAIRTGGADFAECGKATGGRNDEGI